MANKLLKSLTEKINVVRRVRNLFRPDNIEPQREYMFEAYFNASGAKNRTIIEIFTEAQIRLYVKSAEFPSKTLAQIPMNYLGTKISYTGKDNSEKTTNLTLWDDEASTVYTFFSNWMRMMSNEYSGKGTSKSTHRANMILRLKDVSDLATTKEIHLINCYPVDLGKVNLSYEASQALEVQITLAFDFMRVIH